MKKDMIMKTVVLIIGLVMIVVVWFGFRTIDNQAQEIDQLKSKIEKKDNQIAYLQENNQSQTKIINNSSTNEIQNTLELFVESVFEVKEGNLQERKGQAETILTQHMFNNVFPKDEKEKVLYEYDTDNIHSYINSKKERASAYVTFEQETKNTKNNEENKSYVTIEVFLQKEGERWLISDFKQINAEPL